MTNGESAVFGLQILRAEVCSTAAFLYIPKGLLSMQHGVCTLCPTVDA